MKTIIADTSERDIYEKLRKMFPNQVITPSILRSEARLTDNANNFKYNVLTNNKTVSGNAPDTTTTLDVADAFFPVKWGWFIAKRAVDAQGNPTQYGRLETYANPRVFNGANEADSLQNLYGGIFQIKIGTSVLLEQESAMKFERIYTSQQGLAASTVAGTGIILRDEKKYEQDLRNLVPTTMFAGYQNIDITHNVANQVSPSLYASQAPNTANFGILIFDGFLIRGGADLVRRG